jgi:aspartate aminotransferase-like enzyme
MKSVLQPGNRVLAVATGLFGYGMGEMARTLGMQVETVGFGYDGIADPAVVLAAAKRFRPHLITAVHCETPSGTLNPLTPLGAVAREVDALFYGDFVASAGGVAVDVDANNIDLGLLGSQKVLSLMPDLAMVSVSERAWARIRAVNYAGYDALAPWEQAIAQRLTPYTHNWAAMAGLRVGIARLLQEGLDESYRRHAEVAHLCRNGLQELGIALWPQAAAFAAPTVTCAKLPVGWSWEAFNRALRQQSMLVGGNYGPLAGQTFRIGHMGSQANRELVEQGLAVIAQVLRG